MIELGLKSIISQCFLLYYRFLLLALRRLPMQMAVFCLMYSFLLGILVLLCLLIFVRQVMAVFDLILTFTMMER